jgi:hypothetical protein
MCTTWSSMSHSSSTVSNFHDSAVITECLQCNSCMTSAQALTSSQQSGGPLQSSEMCQVCNSRPRVAGGGQGRGGAAADAHLAHLRYAACVCTRMCTQVLVGKRINDSGVLRSLRPFAYCMCCRCQAKGMVQARPEAQRLECQQRVKCGGWRQYPHNHITGWFCHLRDDAACILVNRCRLGVICSPGYDW